LAKELNFEDFDLYTKAIDAFKIKEEVSWRDKSI